MDFKHIPKEIPKKTCKRCDNEQPIFEFARNRSKSGHNHICKTCYKKNQKRSINQVIADHSPEPPPFRIW